MVTWVTDNAHRRGEKLGAQSITGILMEVGSRRCTAAVKTAHRRLFCPRGYFVFGCSFLALLQAQPPITTTENTYGKVTETTA